jgi:hypothetical protein
MNHFDRRLIIIVAAALMALPGSALARAESPAVTELMTSEEFRAAGLDKLSSEEIEALNRWIARFTARDQPPLRQQSDVAGQEVERADGEGFRTRIRGEFRGWYGKTIFRLENGQTWKQRLSGRWFYRANSPEVEIRKNFMGYWEMHVVEADRSVGVTRVDEPD